MITSSTVPLEMVAGNEKRRLDDESVFTLDNLKVYFWSQSNVKYLMWRGVSSQSIRLFCAGKVEQKFSPGFEILGSRGLN